MMPDIFLFLFIINIYLSIYLFIYISYVHDLRNGQKTPFCENLVIYSALIDSLSFGLRWFTVIKHRSLSIFLCEADSPRFPAIVLDGFAADQGYAVGVPEGP